MKPHPRLRKTIKWGGAAVTVLLVVVWIGSGWVGGGWMSKRGAGLAVMPGRLVVSLQSFPFENEFGGWRSRIPREPMEWWFEGGRGNFGWNVWVPIWLPAIMLGLASAAAWRRDHLVRRRARLNLCPKCNYDRAGIAGDAKCPECGSTPA
jgi:hypothetical protein